MSEKNHLWIPWVFEKVFFTLLLKSLACSLKRNLFSKIESRWEQTDQRAKLLLKVFCSHPNFPHVPCMSTTALLPSDWLLLFTATPPPSLQGYEGSTETTGIKQRRCTLNAVFALGALVRQACDDGCWYKIQFQAKTACQCPARGVFTWLYSLLTLETFVERLTNLW